MRRLASSPSFVLLLVVALVPMSAWTQSRPPAGGSSGGTRPTSPTPSVPNNPSRPPTQNVPTFPGPDINRPIFLRGKVVLDQGGGLTEPVPIQRICAGNTHREGYTDMKGNFSILVGENTPFQDASETGTFSGRPNKIDARQLWNCEIRAYLPGYTSSTISLAGRDFNDTSEIGTIVLQKIGGVEGNSISVTSLKAPDKARKEYQKALEAYEKRKYQDTEKHVAKALEIYPQYASAWELRGKGQQQQKQLDEAHKSYQSAIEADDKFVAPYLRLAILESGKQNWAEVLRLTDRALSLDPVSYPDAYFLNGVAKYQLHQYAEAEKSTAKAVSMDRDHRLPRAVLLLATLLQRRGDNTGAAEHFRTFLKLEPTCPEAPQINAFLAKMDKSTALATPAKTNP